MAELDALRVKEPSPQPSPTKRKVSFFYEDEEILIKPSTELIPDEYEHTNNKDVLLHVFHDQFETQQLIKDDLFASLKCIGYDLDHNNEHGLTTKENFQKDIFAIKDDCANKSALVIFFIGFFKEKENSPTILFTEDENYIELKEIWNCFSANNCMELKYKPKVLIFCTSPVPKIAVQTDSLMHRTLDYEQAYDFPAEADMLIVYQKDKTLFGQNKIDFINQLCKNIETYSKKYDIIDLVSYINDDSNEKTIPLVISTLTRKFFLTSSDEREHYLSVTENFSDLENVLETIQHDLQKLQEESKKKKDKLFSFSSFRKKGEQKPKVVKHSEASKSSKKLQDVVPKTVTSPKVTEPRIGRITTDSSTSTFPRSRSRAPSESESTKSSQKPKWKI